MERPHEKEGRWPLGAENEPWLTVHKETESSSPHCEGLHSASNLSWEANPSPKPARKPGAHLDHSLVVHLAWYSRLTWTPELQNPELIN